MKFLISFLIVSFFLLPSVSSAAEVCSSNGYTIATINGVFTDERGAAENMDELKNVFRNATWHGQSVNFDYLLNPPHLGGIGDLTMAVYQKFFDERAVLDYDLVEMLKAASEKVTTQKLLLVAHSQGNFYANSLYDAIAGQPGGVPKESLGVYGVATPAGRVAGNGKWLTSDTDTVIAGLVEKFPSKNIMLPNTHIALQNGDDMLGHDFANVYLKYRSDQITSDIQNSLDGLQTNNAQDAQKPCIEAPALSVAHRVAGAVLAVADPVANSGVFAVGGAVAAQQYVGTAIGNGVIAIGKYTMQAMKNVGSAAFALVYSPPGSLVPQQQNSFDVQRDPASGSLEAGSQAEVVSQNQQQPIQRNREVSQDPISRHSEVGSQAEVNPPVNQQSQTVSDQVPAQQPILQEVQRDPALSEVQPQTQPIFVATGGGWVSGVSADFAPTVSSENQGGPASGSFEVGSQLATSTASSTQDITLATSTDSVTETATSTDETATTTEPVIPPPPAPQPEIIYADPVVINEVAWMGTHAQANDEWVELYNKTNRDIDLARWTLASRNQRTPVQLAGIIPARGYFLLERTATTTTDQREDMLFTGALNNAGPDANLYLKNGTTTIDFIDLSFWPAGDNAARKTMERVSPYGAGNYAPNWKTYDATVTPFAKDARGNDILGTPKAKNSVAGLYTPAYHVTADARWEKQASPYFIPSVITVAAGATLTIEPGVTVKFAKGTPHGGGLIVEGVVRAEGTPQEAITFTSAADDAADGVDIDRDGAAVSPAPGDWLNINLLNTERPSVFAYVRVAYGGAGTNYNLNGWYPTYTGAVTARNASPEIADSVFSRNTAAALYVEGDAHPRIVRNRIEDTAAPSGYGSFLGGTGIRLADASSTADIIGNVFARNDTAIGSRSASATALVVRDNEFSGNRRNGELYATGGFHLENAGNRDRDSRGGWHVGFSVHAGESVILHADAMPYLFVGGEFITIEERGVLTVEPGAVLKSARTAHTVRGTLDARGTEELPIIFTSVADDGDGYDSNDASDAPQEGDWGGIQFLGASSSDSMLEHVAVRYGGSGTNTCPHASFGGPCMQYQGAVYIHDAGPTIAHATIDHNLAVGIYIDGAAGPAIRDSSIANTAQGFDGPRDPKDGYGVSVGPASFPTLENNTYSGNVRDVVYRRE